MRFTCILLCAFILWGSSSANIIIYEQQSDRSDYYTALNSSDVKLIYNELNDLAKHLAKDTLAYNGALRMKLAGLLSAPVEKLKMFKEGREKLESAIHSDPNNIEYRFLRLIIQENAPGILNYKQNLEEDKNLIVKKVKTLNTVLLSEMRKYSETSKILLPAYFNE